MALGGGTIVDKDGKIGPRSVGYRITEKALVFGGDTLTTTDIAVAAGIVEIGDRDRVKHLDPTLVRARLAGIHAMVEDGVDRMKTSAGDMPIVVVGGGAFLVPDKLAGVSEVIHVEHAGVANALGAAMAQVSGEVDQVFSGLTRDQALTAALELATQRAIEAGADPATINTVDAEDIPIAYLPGDARRVRARVVGSIGTPGMKLVA
jgi:N-methylhydantoinase A/oxoprolinase/acetone carboxylase beta subunit